MLTIYRRHLKNCAHRGDGRDYRRCRCPLWVDGFLRDQEVRRSLGMRDWEKAQTTIRAWEDEGVQTDEKDREPTTIEQAGKDYLADAEARQLQERTVYKYRLLFRQLNAFAKLQGVRFLKELDTPALRKFRTTWKDSNLAALKKLERLRSFFRFARENGWLPNNPSEKLSNPKVTMRPTLSFSQVEMVRILAATTATIEKSPSDAKNNARRLRALVLLLRYTGLRIGDAVSCSVSDCQTASCGSIRRKRARMCTVRYPSSSCENSIPSQREVSTIGSGRATANLRPPSPTGKDASRHYSTMRKSPMATRIVFAIRLP
jgi:integrase